MEEKNEGTKMREKMNKSTETDLNGRPLQMILDEDEIKSGEIKNGRGRFLEWKLVRFRSYKNLGKRSWNGSL